jgi:hypothetical protein
VIFAAVALYDASVLFFVETTLSLNAQRPGVIDEINSHYISLIPDHTFWVSNLANGVAFPIINFIVPAFRKLITWRETIL